jgi:hypothetical protein
MESNNFSQLNPKLLEQLGFRNVPLVKHLQRNVFQYELNGMEIVLFKYGTKYYTCVQRGFENEPITDVHQLKQHYHHTTGKYLS